MRLRLLALAVLAGTAIGTAACGESSAPPAAPGSPERPLAGTTRSVGGVPASGHSNEAAASSSRKGSEPGYDALLKSQSKHPLSRFTPCNLVTRKQAAAILGAPMLDPVEAAQGPTCVYRSKNGRSFVALAVQSLDFGRIQPHLRLSKRVTVGGRTAYCGTYGQPMLYVPLSGGRVLSVTGRCAIARQFAGRAVRQL